jgi:hypothetical protein
MRKLTLFTALMAASSFAAEWKGVISEAGCGLKHSAASAGAEKCVTACVKKGQAPVLVTDGKVVKIANGDKVMDFLGKSVVVTGKLAGDTVTIESVKAGE